MSLPDFDPQRSFFDAAELCDRVLSQPGANRFKLFRENVWPALAKQRANLAQMYCVENGRPAEEPVRMMGILILTYPFYLANRGKLKTRNGSSVFWVLTNLFAAISLLLIVLPFIAGSPEG